MADRKQTFFSLLNTFPKIFSIPSLIKMTGQNLIFPFYHVVSDMPKPHLKHLYTIRNTKQFIQDLDFLLKNYRPIDLFELMEHILGHKLITQNAFHLTFDDGLEEFYSIVAPILKEKGIPASCFLNTDFIDNKDLFFRYTACTLIDKVQLSKPSKSQEKSLNQVLVSHGLKPGNLTEVIRNIKFDKKEVLDELAKILEVDIHDYCKEYEPYLSEKQIQDLIEDGFTFGGHSIDHPDYSFLNLEEQLRQTIQSSKTIKDKFNLNYSCFSFPFTDDGIRADFFSNIEGKIDVSFGTAGLKNEELSYHFQRIPVENYSYSAQDTVYYEYLYYLLKKPFGKNLIPR